MRRSMSAFVLALLVCSAQNARGQEKPPTADEAAIQQSAVDFVDAYNAQNADAMIALFNPKARVETADGEVIEGVDKIKAGFEQVFKDEPDGLISLRMDSLIFITPDVAIEQGATEFFPDGEMLTTRSKYLVAHLKKDGKWKMISVRTLNEEVVSNYEFLRQLKFFVGEWIDEDPDSVVESKVYWDEGKNFLIHDFNVRRGSEWIQKGTQRIGWDPQAKRIRGWVFDSQGGFGESSWEFVDGSWIVKATGVTSEGGNGSSTRTLTPEGDRIRVRISDRIADGQKAPEIEFLMVRKPPAPATASAPPAQKGGAR
jgi:uncharacterized protein (TIGR02246 family)